MKRRLFFFFCFISALEGCVSFKNISSSIDNFEKIWHPLIRELTVGEAPLNAYLDEDLLLLHEQELAALKSAWQMHAETLKNPPKRDEYAFYQEKIAQLNEKSLQVLASSTIPPGSYEHVNLEKIHESLQQSLTTRQMRTYQASDQIGFCFGRALLAHYLLLQQGVSPKHIYKIFALDDMKVGHQIWHFHVAVIVRDKQWGFVVIDSLQPRIMPYQEWLLEVQKYSIKYPFPQTRFYVADPRKFLPASGAYDISWLSSPPLKAYFFDLGQELHKKSGRVKNYRKR